MSDATFDGFEDVEYVAEGGLGRVFRARRASTGGEVAIKEIKDLDVGSSSWKRAEREVEALVRLKGHPNVVSVEEIIEGPNGPCLVMEYLDAGSLADRLKSGPIPVVDAVRIARSVLTALGAAHQVGIVHRDIKPQNVLIGSFGQVKVCDFGISAIAREDGVTQTNASTLAYASPEELDGSGRVGPAADVYSFGVMMVHLLTGERPTFADRAAGRIAWPAELGATQPWAKELLTASMAIDPAERPSIAQLARAFGVDGHEPMTPPHAPAAVDPTVPRAAAVGALPPNPPPPTAVDPTVVRGPGTFDPRPNDPVSVDRVVGPVALDPPRVAAPQRRSITVARVAAVATPIIVVLALFIGLTMYGQSGYFVAFADNGRVAIYSGRPGGFLWVDPAVERYGPHDRGDLDDDSIELVEQTPSFDSASAASSFIQNRLETVPVEEAAADEPADVAVPAADEPAIADDEPTVDAPEPDEPSAAEPALVEGDGDGVLRFGGILPETGNLAFLGPPEFAGVELAVQEINAAGGVLGRAVEWLPGDSGDNGEVANATVDRLLAEDVDAFIGAASSGVSLTVVDKITQAGKIQFSPANTSPVFTDYDDNGLYFRTAASDAVQGAALADVMLADGAATAAFLVLNDSYGTGLQKYTIEPYTAGGGTVVYGATETYDPMAGNFDAEIAAVVEANPDAIVIIGFEETAQILGGLIEAGFGPADKLVYGTDGNMGSYLAFQFDDPSVLAGMKGTLPGVDVVNGLPNFRDALMGVDPQLIDFSYSAESYDAVIVTALAAIAAGSDDGVAVAAEINDVTRDGVKCATFAECKELLISGTDIDYDGVSGPLEFIDAGEPSQASILILEYDRTGSIFVAGSVMGTIEP